MMPRVAQSVLLASAILAASACGDRDLTTPAAASPGTHLAYSRALTGSTVSGKTIEAVRVLKRSTALPQNESVDAVIGPAGGDLEIPSAGVHVTFAPGAVTAPVHITMTASAGTAVAYEFQPHGLRFHAPVVVRQDLKHTIADADALLAASLQGSYFEGSLSGNLVGVAGNFAHIKEGKKGRLKSSNRYLDFTIEHFSGYMVSTGLVSVDVEIEIGR